ncbi:proprotein convertase P-domain-containing protein [Streptomyces sp. 1222.5]|uniref:proprotein convertase P-domain-containing protein n=1 Tax=Streptomyces sp. 1222.5 TaxID=1881026 RepID=UPI003EB7EE1F
MGGLLFILVGPAMIGRAATGTPYHYCTVKAVPKPLAYREKNEYHCITVRDGVDRAFTKLTEALNSALGASGSNGFSEDKIRRLGGGPSGAVPRLLISPFFQDYVNSVSYQDRRILSIEATNQNFGGSLLIIWGNGTCTQGTRRVVPDTDHRYMPMPADDPSGDDWRDNISAYAAFNKCWAEHFKHDDEDDYYGGGNTLGVFDNSRAEDDFSYLRVHHGNDDIQSIELTGGLPDSEAQTDCDNGDAECQYQAADHSIRVKGAWEYVTSSANCGDAKMTVGFDKAITKSTTVTWGLTLTVTVTANVEGGVDPLGVGAKGSTSIARGLSMQWQKQDMSSETSTYKSTIDIPPGEIAILESAAAVKTATGHWTIDYGDDPKWYHRVWQADMTSEIPAHEGIAWRADPHPMSAQQWRELCGTSGPITTSRSPNPTSTPTPKPTPKPTSTAKPTPTPTSFPTPTPAVFSSATDVNIPDNGRAIFSPITVSRSGYAPKDLKVRVDIWHTWKGDLTIDLISPDGSAYPLKKANPNNFNNGVERTYTVDASSEKASGVWKLRVQDVDDGDSGYLDGWELIF